MEQFVNREIELNRLRDLYDSNQAELAVIFGRRRLGKTELAKTSIKSRDDAVIYQARQVTSELQLQKFLARVGESYPGVTQIREDWETVLSYLADQDAIVVLDEFPYLIEQDESLPSVIQALFDHAFDESKATFVLVGSSISMMEEATLLGNSPLYGRSSLKLDIGPLQFNAAMEFVPEHYSPAEKVMTWGVFGGVPYYLEELSPEKNLGENIQQAVLSQHGSLRNEPDYILRMELTEPTRYFSILEAIAGGHTSRNEIAGATGIDYNQLSKYLQRLSRLRLVEQQVPITERRERTKRSRYRIRDQFMRFWFHFVYGRVEPPNDMSDQAYETQIAPELPNFISLEFELLCCQALWSLYSDFTIEKVGQWWYNEHELDVVGLTEDGTLIAGECKFQQSPFGYRALASLERHVDELQWSPPGQVERDQEFALFSRNGFTSSVEEAAAERDDLRLFSVEDVVSALQQQG